MKDLFEYYQEQPQELKNVLNQWQDRINNGLDYNQCAQLLREVEAVGFTFEYELSAEPFNLRKIEPIQEVYIEVPHVEIGQKIKTRSRTQFDKIIERKVTEKQISYEAGVLRIRVGYKTGKTTYFNVLQDLQELNGFLITGEKAKVYLYKFTTPETIYPYGDTFYQLIAEYNGLKYRYRFFIENPKADGTVDTWYLNDWNNSHIPLKYGVKTELNKLTAKTVNQ